MRSFGSPVNGSPVMSLPAARGSRSRLDDQQLHVSFAGARSHVIVDSAVQRCLPQWLLGTDSESSRQIVALSSTLDL